MALGSRPWLHAVTPSGLSERVQIVPKRQAARRIPVAPSALCDRVRTQPQAHARGYMQSPLRG